MKQKVYTINDNSNEPRVTVCIIEDNGTTARGLALRSLDDPYIKHIGDDIAQRNAIRALNGRNVVPIRTKVSLYTLLACKCPWVRRCERNPILSAYERRLLFGRGWANERYSEKQCRRRIKKQKGTVNSNLCG